MSADDKKRRGWKKGRVTTRGVYQWCHLRQEYVLVERESFEYEGPWALAHTSANFVQQNWRFRNDDGTLSTATFAAAENTAANSGEFSPGDKFRIRFNLGDDANADANNSGTPTLQYRVDQGFGFGSWINVPTTAGADGIQFASSDNSITDGSNETTQRLSTIAGSTYQSSWMEFDDNGSQTSRTYTDDYTEFEYCLQVVTGTGGWTYELRLLDPTGSVPDSPPTTDASMTVFAAQTFNADLAGRIALRGAPKAAKTVSSDLAGRMSFRGVNLYERNPRAWLNSIRTLSGATEMTVTAFNSAGTQLTFTDPPGAPTGNLEFGIENMMLGGGEANTGWRSVSVTASGFQAIASGRMAVRGYGKATKVGASDVAGRLALRGFDIAAKASGADIAGRSALRASSAASKTSTGTITGRSALRAFLNYSLTIVVAGVAVGRAAIRGIGTAAKTISSDLAGRMALRGSDAAAKTASSDITGNVAVRSASATSKTASGDLSGRMSLRAIIKATVAGTVNGVVRGIIALRGFGTAAKTTTSSARGRMSLRAFVAASAAAVVFAAQIRGRIALRAFSNVAFQKEASIRAAIALRAASAANGVRAGSAVGRLSQRFLGAGAKTASGHPITHIPIRGKSVYALGQLGTISRVVELDAIFDRRISLSGTFDPTNDVNGVFDNVGGLQGKADPV